MQTDDLKPQQWYWIRREDGSLAPYRFHKISQDPRSGCSVGEFFVGSFLRTFALSAVVGEARMPKEQRRN